MCGTCSIDLAVNFLVCASILLQLPGLRTGSGNIVLNLILPRFCKSPGNLMPRLAMHVVSRAQYVAEFGYI